MTRVVSTLVNRWDSPCSGDIQQQAATELEDGNVLFFPELSFSLRDSEHGLLCPETVGKSKNVSWDGSSGRLRGSDLEGALRESLLAMMERYAASTLRLLHALLPDYGPVLVPSRTSFRPVEAAGRSTSWRKDDTRLHVDSFPSMPVHGKRILRVFSNVNPNGLARSWRLGGSFEAVAQRFLPSLTRPVWGSGRLLHWCSITRSERTPYDHYMLQLHDRMKADNAYQSSPENTGYDFPPNTTWMVFTDQVPHAARQGQYLLEQTFLLPVAVQRDPSRAPLRVLERMMSRALV
jgi:hypothetical protein